MILSSISAQSSINLEIPRADRLQWWIDPTKGSSYEVENYRLKNKGVIEGYLTNSGGGSIPAYVNGATVVYGPNGASNEFLFSPSFSYQDSSRNWTIVIFQKYIGGAGLFFAALDPLSIYGLIEDKQYYVRSDGTGLDAGEQTDGKIHMFSVTKNDTNFKSYVNKTLRLNTTSNAGGPRNPIIFPDGQAVEAYFGPILIYNTALTENEIEGIYEYYKIRYGLG